MNSVPKKVHISVCGQPEQEGYHTWCDAVTVKRLLLGQLLAFSDGLLARFLSIQGGPETPGALLVHLGARGDTINGHKKQLFGFDLSKQMLDVVENGDKHLLFAEAEGNIVRILVCTVMDNAIHIQLQDEVS